MVCVFFEVFPKQFIGKCLTVERVGYVEDPSLVSVSGMPNQGPFVMDCGAPDLRTFCVEHGLGRFFYCFFFLSFSCLPMHLCVCLSLPPVFWSMQAHMPDLRQETGPTHDVAYQKETVYKRLAEWNVKRCASNNEVVLCKFSIHQHCKLIKKKLKKNSNAKIKKLWRKRNRNVEVLLQLRKKLIRIVHGCRYSVASEKWADCSTVLISMRAVIESAKFEEKVEQRIQSASRKAKKKKKRVKKKCYYSSETNSSGLCIVAGVQRHHANELTVVLSSKVQIWKKKKKKERKKKIPKIEN